MENFSYLKAKKLIKEIETKYQTHSSSGTFFVTVIDYIEGGKSDDYIRQFIDDHIKNILRKNMEHPY